MDFIRQLKQKKACLFRMKQLLWLLLVTKTSFSRFDHFSQVLALVLGKLFSNYVFLFMLVVFMIHLSVIVSKTLWHDGYCSH